MRTKLATVAVAFTLATVGLATSPALASPAPSPSQDASTWSGSEVSTMSIPPGCSAWMDYLGRGRAHINCEPQNVDVRVTVKCANNKTYNSDPYWRYQYNKAECPPGVGAVSMSGATR